MTQELWVQRFWQKKNCVNKKAFVTKIKYILVFLLLFAASLSVEAATGKQPITVNGDTVEFKSEGKEILAQGNVEIVYQESKITCDKVKVFIDEKIAIADGHVRFRKETGEEMSGETIIYDFNAQSGTIISADISMPPYYGRTELMEKISSTDFLMEDGVLSTCDLPHPHWSLGCDQAEMKPGNILTAKGVKIKIGDVPIMYIPQYSQRITDKRPRFMITPGHSKELGTFALGSWRYYLNENAKGLLHFDWYQEKGWGEGVDLNYNTKIMGEGNVKYYRIDEEDKRVGLPDDLKRSDQRSRVELRHRWDPTDRDHVMLELFKSSNADFRKTYFFREYEKEPNPQTYFLYSHVYPNATLSFQGSPRVNPFEAVLQKVPELKLETVNQKIAGTNWYYKNTTAATHLMNTVANGGVTADVSRVDTSNQVSYIFRFMSVDFSPFVGERNTYYSRGVNAKESYLRDMFFAGIDASTKFFRTFDVDTDFWNLNIHKIRHIVTPSIQYRYQDQPSVNLTKLIQLDDVDSLDAMDKVTFTLENKLQTKRNGASVDLATLILSADYNIESNYTLDSGFLNFKYDLEFKPYKWWELDTEGEYDTRAKYFKTMSTDYWMDVGKSRTVLGYRYKRDESSQLTAGLTCPLNPFWKLGIYERFEFDTGNLVEQEYRLTRDLHCWNLEFVINQRETDGLSFFVEVRLKAFPEIGVNAEKTFSPPRTQ